VRLCAKSYGWIAAYLYDDNELSEERAEEFLPYRDRTVKYGRGRPLTGWFGELVRASDLDAAGYGAQLAAPDDSRTHLYAALDIVEQAIALQGDTKGRVWDGLRERRDRIIVRQYAKPRRAPLSTRNKRSPRLSLFVVTNEPKAPTAPVRKAKARKRPAASAAR